MASFNVQLSESPLANAAGAVDVGTLFVAGLADEGPSLTPTPITSLVGYSGTFGPRSATSAILWDAVEHYFNNGGAQAYIVRVSDQTAAKASLTLNDSGGHPTVSVTAQTAGTDGNAIYVVVTSSAVEIEDSSGDVLETHAFSSSNAALLGASSAYVSFAQASGSGFTTNAPATLTSTALSGGADASDITASSYASALASIPSTLGPGTVIAPGQTSATVALALFQHAFLNNRFAVVDQVDATTSASAISALQALGIPTAFSKAGIVVQGTMIKPPTGGATANKVVPGSAAVAALRAQAAASTPMRSNPAPAGSNWPIAGLIGFTTAVSNMTPGATASWAPSDVTAMTSAGLCFFGQLYGVNCLDEFVTPDTTDVIFDQATAWTECMAFVADVQQLGPSYQFQTLDGQGLLITALHRDIASIVQTHWLANALYGDTANDAAAIQTGSPVNTTATAQAGQLNANVALKISDYADAVNIGIDILSLTQSLPTAS